MQGDHLSPKAWSLAATAKVNARLSFADAGSNSSKGSDTTDVKDDIASRKKEAQQWISEWREATGGK